MYHFTNNHQDAYPVCILTSQVRLDEIRRAYMSPYGIGEEDAGVLQVESAAKGKKVPIKLIRQHIAEVLLPELLAYRVQYVLCPDTAYFKELAGVDQADAYAGYVMPTKHGFHVIYVPSYRTIFYDPVKVKSKIARCVEALILHVKGEYEDPGCSIITHAEYPQGPEAIKAALDKLLAMDLPLTIDIEAFSLKFYESGIGTISFCWSQNEGIAFPVDYEPIPGATEAPYGIQAKNEVVRALLKDFFIKYLQKQIYHNITFDVTVLIYQLFMSDICDIEGMQEGLDVMLRNFDCTKLITYLATNTCAGNELGLKPNSQEFAGNYSVGKDIKDIRNIPLNVLLKYNLIDGLSTWYVYKKNYPRMANDQQEPVYLDHFKPYAIDIVEMQLTGLPIDIERTREVNGMVGKLYDDALRIIQNSPVVLRFERRMSELWADKKNAEYKKKRVTPADFPDKFNPNSGDQLQGLLFDMLKLPVISYTKTKQPSTDADTIKALLHHTKDPDVLALLKAIQEVSLYSKLLNTFLPAMLNAQQGSDGWYYLFGSYNLGGAISGRLSSSEPNLQNMPVKGDLGKLIKSCFGCDPNGEWLFCGLDFASLEDRISALTTKDPNKLKVYTDGYDGHCLRAYAYFGDQMPDIDPNIVASINSIEKKYKDLRGESKAPTFALTYQGTEHTLMKNCGFSAEKAATVTSRYKALYKVSIDWVEAKLKQAGRDGYITGAFGLRVRTPLLKQSIRGTSRTPHEVDAEGRSAGNALGQSWCLLNNRASAEFMGKVRKSEFRKSIRLSAHIHDAQYFRIKNNIESVMYLNEHLVEAVKWQNHPDIWHEDVKLGGEVGIFYPNWCKEITIPNGASAEEIYSLVDAAQQAT